MNKLTIVTVFAVIVSLWVAPTYLYPVLPLSVVLLLGPVDGVRSLVLAFLLGVVTILLARRQETSPSEKVEKPKLVLKRKGAPDEVDAGLLRMRDAFGGKPKPKEVEAVEEPKLEAPPIQQGEIDWKLIAMTLLKEKENGSKQPEPKNESEPVNPYLDH